MAMKHLYRKPHALLSDYVRTVLILEGASEPGPDDLPLFTNGMPALLCHTERDQSGNEYIMQLALFGRSTPSDNWAINGNSTVIAYFFMPFALASLFGIPAAQLMSGPVDLCNRHPHQTNALRTQLICAGAAARKVEVLDDLLIHQLQQHGRECGIIRYATDRIMCDPGKEALSETMKALDISERTFQRIFKKYVGITPSQYRRICQFQLSFTQLKGGRFNSLTDVAYDNGFADQSHFIRSFREFTQTTPNNYLRDGLKTEDP